ncbi:RNA polymerase II-binding domain-containing protein [Staphylotrichum tortipilum]|uniref:RNA polymerase II-binding domain-containing protein n=1 Tax=Staphylotrichum tortipilum TaxID=2831512 RepID=A0AAN6MIH6_9PEZI|nr:RNA polymerase II-binding domain-containing protein [Staphylotrichum longicolle]
MAYTDDAVLSKLSALNESHESIATTAQWIMFHRRHASQTVHLWLTKLKDLPSPKRLNMIYLANEVTQQSKARHKEDFLNAFSPFIADAASVAYKGAPSDVQSKLRRVIDVWRERNIFDKDVLNDLESRLGEIDRSRPAAKVTGFGGHGFNAAAGPAVAFPQELTPLVAPQQALAKSQQPAKTSINTANADYDKLSDPASANAPLPVQAARLSGLLKTLANAEGAVTQCIRTRKDLIKELEKILATNREALDADEKQMMELSGRRTEVEQQRQAVEMAILGGLSATAGVGASAASRNPVPEPDRPQVEALTPPHVQDHADADDFYGGSGDAAAHNGADLPFHSGPAAAGSAAPDLEMLSNLASQYQAVPLNGAAAAANKKRKIEASDEFPDLGGDDGIDADVKEMLRNESQG